MNILISTTTGHNPGDQFIYKGVMNLLESLDLVSSDDSIFIYDRNPDFMEAFPHKQELVQDYWGNRENLIDWTTIDAVILAGSPEWLHEPLKHIYEGLSANPSIPLLAIGVGYSNDNLKISELEKKVLLRDNSKIICRSLELKQKVDKQLGNAKAAALPCPAIFSGDGITKSYEYSAGYILQNPKGIQGSGIDVDITGHEKDARFIAFHINDVAYLKTKVNKYYYSWNPDDLLEKISECRYIQSTRLHGAIAAIGMGIPANIICKPGNIRIENAAKMYDKFLPINSKSSMDETKLNSLKNHIRTMYEKELNTWKW